MENKSIYNYLEWFEKAEEDEISIKAILKEMGSPSTVCFLSQQMAEKYLKGLLVFHNKSFPKVHDLLELETRLLQFEPEINEIHENIKTLNRYYIETRYPGDYPEFDWEESKEAYQAAAQIKQFVLRKISGN